jgi:hypothetical protein
VERARKSFSESPCVSEDGARPGIWLLNLYDTGLEGWVKLSFGVGGWGERGRVDACLTVGVDPGRSWFNLELFLTTLKTVVYFLIYAYPYRIRNRYPGLAAYS